MPKRLTRLISRSLDLWIGIARKIAIDPRVDSLLGLLNRSLMLKLGLLRLLGRI